MDFYQAWGPRKPTKQANFVLAHAWKETSNFKKIWFYLKGINFTLNTISFFTLFALIPHSINTQHTHKTRGRNPSPLKQPYFLKNSSKLAKFVFLFPATFSHPKPFHCVPEVIWSKYTSLPMVETAWIVPYMFIHIQNFLDFAFLLSVCFNRI